MWPFKCDHPAEWLQCRKPATVKAVDKSFQHVTYHMQCMQCGIDVDLRHSELVGGVTEFLNRKPEDDK